MKYGVARRLDVYGIESGKGESIITSAGDWARADRWCREHLEGDGSVVGLLQTFCWAWFALQRTKKLTEYGVTSELTVDGLYEMLDILTVDIEEIEDDSLPLKVGRAK